MFGTPHHEVGGIPPVPGLGDVRLVAEDLWRGHGQIGVPVVEAVHDPTDEVDEPRTRRVGHHGHRGDRREPRAPVRAVGLDGVHVRGRGHLHGLLPARAYQPALAAGLLELTTLDGVVDDRLPCEHRIVVELLGLAVHLQQHAPDVRVAHAGGRVGVPRERRTARAPAGLVLGAVRTHGGVVRLLRLPRDDAVLDVHLPRARPRAVHTVGGAHHLVVAPAVAVEGVTRATTLTEDGAAVRRLLPAGEETSHFQQRI